MWMAVILVCLNGDKLENSCFTVISKSLYKSEEVCISSIITGYELGIFTSKSTSGEYFLPTDFICHNWTKEGDPV